MMLAECISLIWPMLPLNETCMHSITHCCVGKDDAKTGSKYADKLAQELEDARMQRARLVASRSRANRPSDTGSPLNSTILTLPVKKLHPRLSESC